MKKLVLLLVCISLLFSGCISKEFSVEHIYQEQQDKEKETSEIQEDVSEKVLENMKGNAEKVMADISKKAEESSKNLDYPDTAEEMLDRVAKSTTDTIAYVLIGFMARLQDVAIWISLFISGFGLILIYINKRNPVARRWSIFLVILGPVLFFIIIYGPALYYSIIK